MARKIRRRKSKRPAAVTITASELRFPGQAKQYWLAVGVLTWACILIAGTGFLVTGKQYWQWVYLAAWPIASILLINFLSDRPRRRQLKQLGPQARVMGNNHPALYQMLQRLSQLLSMPKPPQMCLVEDEAPYIYSLAAGKGTIIVTRALVDLLTPEELAVMVGHELTHIKCHDLRLGSALSYIRIVSPLIAFFCGPVWVWSVLMGEWPDIIDYTADRGAVLVTGDLSLVNATLVKVAAEADPQAEVTSQDIEDYLSHGRQAELDAVQMERQFKLNRFIESQPNLRDRIEQVVEFSQSEEGQALLEKEAELRQHAQAGR